MARNTTAETCSEGAEKPFRHTHTVMETASSANTTRASQVSNPVHARSAATRGSAQRAGAGGRGPPGGSIRSIALQRGLAPNVKFEIDQARSICAGDLVPSERSRRRDQKSARAL